MLFVDWLGEIIVILSTMLPHRDFEVGFVERIAQGPIQPIATQSQRLEPSTNSQFSDGELVAEFGGSYRHYMVGYVRHFSFDPEIEDLISRRYRLAPISYHPLWDGLAPSFVDGIGSCKLHILQYRHTQDSLSEIGFGGSDSGTYGCCHIHSAIGCKCQIDRDLSFDRVDVSVGLSSTEWFLLLASIVGLQMILLVM